MKATYDGSYFKQAPEGSPAGTPGKMVFRYKVSGTKAELDAYKKAQGAGTKTDNYRETDDGKNTPLWFSVRPTAKTVTLSISRSGGVFADNSELERLKLLAIEYPNLAPEINKQMAGILFAQSQSVATPVASSVKIDQEG